MKRLLLVPVLLIVLSACGATEAASTVRSAGATATAVVETSADEPVPTPTQLDVQRAAPVTPIMQELELTGEPFATAGDPNAPITVVEFSDYGCPFCRRFVSTTYPMIKQDYIDTGKVYYVFKDFPIVQLHPQAHIASEAAECAGEQGKYWSMHAALFSAPSEWDTTEAAARGAFTGYAGDIGLDVASFEACMADGRYRPAIATNVAEGRHMGMTGTPMFIVNGKLLAGAQSAEIFQRVLDRELKQQP